MPLSTAWTAIANVEREVDDAKPRKGCEQALFEVTTNTHEAPNDA